MELYKKIETKNPKIEIEIVYDIHPLDPRGDGNLATLLCAHRRYELGDEQLSHDCNSFTEALCQWVYENNSEADYFHRQYVEGWMLAEMIEAIRDGELDPEDEDAVANWEEEWSNKHGYPEDDPLIDTWGVEKFLEQEAEVSPLYLYDHSGITIRTTPFSCRWDSGQVGFALVYKSQIEKGWGTLENWRETANRIIEGEIKDYDDYLTGNCFGFRVLKDDEEVDSCWGYLGSPEDSGVIEDAKRSADYTIEQLAKEDAEVRYWACRDVVTEI